MACRSPVNIQSPLNNGKYIYVPCGRCAWCRRDKRNEWKLRFQVEQRDNLFTQFVTLTYSDDNLPVHIDDETGEFNYVASKEDVQKFVKRLRKAGYKFKYFIVSELAPKSKRPHYHGLFFSNDYISSEEYTEKWKKGITDVQPAGEGSLAYVTKYILKGNDRENNFMLCSKKPAIGAGYVKYSNAKHTYRKGEDGIYQFSMPVVGGQLMPMPRYYKKKFKQFFDELEFDMNKVKLITEMEKRDKYYYLEKKFNDKKIMKDENEKSDKYVKFLEHIQVNYNRDVNKQIEINKKSKI